MHLSQASAPTGARHKNILFTSSCIVPVVPPPRLCAIGFGPETEFLGNRKNSFKMGGWVEMDTSISAPPCTQGGRRGAGTRQQEPHKSKTGTAGQHDRWGSKQDHLSLCEGCFLFQSLAVRSAKSWLGAAPKAPQGRRGGPYAPLALERPHAIPWPSAGVLRTGEPQRIARMVVGRL